MGLDRLVNRPRPAAVYPVKAVESTAAAERAVEQATDQYRFVQLLQADGKQADVRAAKRKLDKATADLEACFEPVTIRALRPEDYEALRGDHKPDKDSDQPWAPDFPRELFLACVEGDLDRAGWDAFLDESASDGERQALLGTALAVNVRPPDETIPKG